MIMIKKSRLYFSILAFVAIAIFSCKKENIYDCNFNYSMYLVELSEESLKQNPFLELKNYAIVKNFNQIDTFELTTDLVVEGNAKHFNPWICKSDSTITERYWYYYSDITAHFTDSINDLTFIFRTKNCPDIHNPALYSEFFELVSEVRFNTGFQDGTTLIRFHTNLNGVSECQQLSTESFYQGELIDEMNFGGKKYSNVWYNKKILRDKEIEVLYSTDKGLMAYSVNSKIYEIIEVK